MFWLGFLIINLQRIHIKKLLCRHWLIDHNLQVTCMIILIYKFVMVLVQHILHCQFIEEKSFSA